MKLESVKISNYKSYADTEEIFIAPKFTVLVGQNNAGKTAFLESLRPSVMVNNPHRKPRREEAFAPITIPTSRVRIQLSVSGAELLHRIFTRGTELYIPVLLLNAGTVEQQIDKLFSSEALQFKLEAQAGSGWASMIYPSHRLFEETADNRSSRIAPSEDRRSWRISGPQANRNDDLSAYLGEYYNDALYIFRAERMNIGQSGIGESAELAPDANNLASVLLQLPRSPAAHELYTQYVREVFPSIFQVVSAPVSNSVARITVIMNDNHRGQSRPGVDVPLSDSGTGISQVLAILYVAVTAPAPRIIVIDEPNSFLHPGAAKKLLAILKRLPHQYIITTHSSEIINSIDPDVVHLVKWDGLATVCETIDRASLQGQRQVLHELGVRLSDVFGADNILWVEGPTEEYCFPLLLQHLNRRSPTTAILALVAPDDLTSRKARSALAWEIYERISNGAALLPPALAFSFDRERRTDSEIEDMRRRSKGKVEFLPRRTYENFLLQADAISAVLAKHASNPDIISPSDIDAWLGTKGRGRKYCDRAEISEEQWSIVVNAPLLLHDLFAESQVEYRKTTHSVELTEWLIAKKPEHLRGLFEYVSRLVAASKDEKENG